MMDLFVQGGPIMPLLALMLVGMLVGAVLRGRFWFQLLKKQQKVARDVLEAARSDLGKASAIAAHNHSLPVGRFLLTPMRLRQPTPEMFHLAMEAAADKEFVEMRKGNRLLELIATLAPLFGLLGVALTVISMFESGNGANTPNFIQGVRQAVIPLAASLVVEIVALTLLRLSNSLQARQAEFFSEVGTMLELYYREFWQADQRRELLKVLHKNNTQPNLPQQPR